MIVADLIGVEEKSRLACITFVDAEYLGDGPYFLGVLRRASECSLSGGLIVGGLDDVLANFESKGVRREGNIFIFNVEGQGKPVGLL